jgi:uncharacterized membrane protein YphA (DoxX/SURF4 family)
VVAEDPATWGLASLSLALPYNRGVLSALTYIKETLLRRLFPAFPGGWPGIALLLLRVVLATTLLVQGGYYLHEPDPSAATWFVGILGIASGALIFVGFLTPPVGVVVGLCAIGIGCSLFPTCTRTLFESYVPVVFAVTILLAIIILGPGAFSIDARLFGRREIIIPPSSAPRR